MIQTIARFASEGHRLLNGKEYDFLSVWDKISFPHRPTEREIFVYRNFIGPTGARALILEATPELRDLVCELRLSPVLVDRSRVMLAGMSKFLKKADPSGETWIQGDWLDVSLPEKFFDVVLADLSLRHVDSKKQKALMRKITNVLKPGGKFIARHHVVNPAYRAVSYDTILKEAEKLPYEDGKYETMGVLLSRLFDASTNNGMTDHKEIIAAIRRYSAKRNRAFSYRLFLAEFMKKRLETLTYPLVSQTKEEIEELFNKRFLIDSVCRGDFYPESVFYPIYCLIPRHGKEH